MNNTITYNNSTHRIEIRTDWNRENLKNLKNLATARFHINENMWSVSKDYAYHIADTFYTLKKTTDFLNLIADLSLPPTVKKTETLEEYLNGKFGTKTLFQHQKEGVIHQLDNVRSIIAADLGTGKTLMSLAAVKYLNLPVHIIAPVSLHGNWKREAEEVGVKIDRLMSSSNVPDPPDEEVALIVDECHLMKNPKSIRTRAFLNYVEKAAFLSLLSGTPIKNGAPAELFPLLTAIHHPIVKSKSWYYARYCKKSKKTKKFRTTGGSNLMELHTAISDKMFVKMKTDCLDLPEKTRMLRIAEPTDQEQGMFDLVFSALQERYYERVKTGKIKENCEALVILSAVRHAASWAKISSTMTLVNELLSEKRPVVLFVGYKDSANALHSEVEKVCKVTILTSDISPKERDKRVQDFQQGLYDAIICTYGTGGIGITLTRSSDVILVDRPWSSGDALQSEDRVHRIGTVNPVTSIWIQQHTIDKHIDDLLLEKQKNVNEVMLGTRDTIEFDSIFDQAESILKEIF